MWCNSLFLCAAILARLLNLVDKEAYCARETHDFMLCTRDNLSTRDTRNTIFIRKTYVSRIVEKCKFVVFMRLSAFFSFMCLSEKDDKKVFCLLDTIPDPYTPIKRKLSNRFFKRFTYSDDKICVRVR